MRTSRTVFVALQLMVIAGAALLYAQQKKLPAMLSPADHTEILQLYGFYARDVDSGTRQSAAVLFTADGVFDDDGKRVEGPAMKQFYDNLQRNRKAAIRHFAGAPVIVPTRDGARGSIYMIEVRRLVKDGPIDIRTFGKYEDTLVRTPKGWRFKERIWRADTHYGDDVTRIMPSLFAPEE